MTQKKEHYSYYPKKEAHESALPAHECINSRVDITKLLRGFDRWGNELPPKWVHRATNREIPRDNIIEWIQNARRGIATFIKSNY